MQKNAVINSLLYAKCVSCKKFREIHFRRIDDQSPICNECCQYLKNIVYKIPVAIEIDNPSPARKRKKIAATTRVDDSDQGDQSFLIDNLRHIRDREKSKIVSIFKGAKSPLTVDNIAKELGIKKPTTRLYSIVLELQREEIILSPRKRRRCFILNGSDDQLLTKINQPTTGKDVNREKISTALSQANKALCYCDLVKATSLHTNTIRQYLDSMENDGSIVRFSNDAYNSVLYFADQNNLMAIKDLQNLESKSTRQMILKVLASSDKPLSASSIAKRIEELNQQTNLLRTVRRTLTKLVVSGQIRLTTKGKRLYYQTITPQLTQ